MANARRRRGWLIAPVLLLTLALAWAAPAFPPLTGRVVDQANLLDAEREARMTQKLADLESRTGTQLVVVTLASLQDHDIDESLRLTEFPLLLTGAQGASTIDKDTFVKLSNDHTWEIESFDLSKIQINVVNPNLALVAYHVHEDLTVDGGEPVSFDAADASVWIRRGGTWKCALHTESLLGDPYGRDRKR